jgi:hypothetical protein
MQTIDRRLREARGSGQPWHVVGRMLRNWLRSTPPEARAAAWRKAARVSAQSEVMLRRYVTAFQRLEAIERATGLARGALLSGAFAPTELALRLYARDAAAGLAALKRVKERELTLRDLRKDLQNTVAPANETLVVRQNTVAARSKLIVRCEGLVATAATTLFGVTLPHGLNPV